jgi:hypothetical protein
MLKRLEEKLAYSIIWRVDKNEYETLVASRSTA